MGERREDLSTADLAGQQPRDPARADLTEATDRERRPDRGPDDPARDDLGPSPARTEDRAGDRAPNAELDRDRLQQQDDRTIEGARDGSRPRRPSGSPRPRWPPTPARPAPPRPARCWPPTMRKASGPAGPTSRPGSWTRHARRSSGPMSWSPRSCSTWPGASRTSAGGWRPLGSGRRGLHRRASHRLSALPVVL
jgi:hypothetical protein